MSHPLDNLKLAAWRAWERLPRRLRPADPPRILQAAFDRTGARILRAHLARNPPRGGRHG